MHRNCDLVMRYYYSYSLLYIQMFVNVSKCHRCYNRINTSSESHHKAFTKSSQMSTDAINTSSQSLHKIITNEYRCYQHIVTKSSQIHHKWAQMLSTHRHKLITVSSPNVTDAITGAIQEPHKHHKWAQMLSTAIIQESFKNMKYQKR